MIDFKKKLQKFNKTFKTAKERAKEEGGFGNEYPDGKYKARLESCTISEAQSSGRLQVAFTFKIAAGEYKNEKVTKYQSVETEDDQVWLARDLKRFGIEAPESGDDLIEIVKLLDECKPELIISLRTKDSGQFCYIDKVTSEIEAGDHAADDNGEGGDGDDGDGNGDDSSDDGDDQDFKEGMDIEFETKSGKTLKGTITEVDEKEKEVTVETPKGSEFTIPFDSVVKPENSEDEVIIEVGMSVKFEGEDGDTVIGKVVKILEDDGMVKVKDEDGEVHRIEADKLSLPDKKKPSASKVKKHSK